MNRPDHIRFIGDAGTAFRDTPPAPQPREARTEPRTEPEWLRRRRTQGLPVKVRWAA